MKKDKIFLLVGIFLIGIILSTIHQDYREGMSDHDKKERLKGEKHGESLIEKDIKHKEKILQDSNQYSNDKYHHKQHHNWYSDDEAEDEDEDNDDEYSHHQWNEDIDDKEYTGEYDQHYGPDSEENIYEPGGEEWSPHHHKPHHHKPHHHKRHHHKPHHHKSHHNEESMNTMNNDSMYMLKSETVPPICPACPQTTACPKKKPCPPCPPCARCPDNNFECKKIPNYEGGDSSILPTNMFGPGIESSSSQEDGTSAPQPYLNSFAQF